MLQVKLFFRTFLLLCVVGALHYLGSFFHLYWEIWWYDIPMHFLGGAVGAMVTILFLKLFNLSSENKNKIIVLTIFSTFCIGIAWEIFELYIGYTSFSDGMEYIFDTTKDLIIDMCGGLFAGLYGLHIISKR
jgi:hypothetical protein